MHYFITLIALTALLAPAAARSCESAPKPAEINAAEIDAVHAQRAAFNAAIAAEELETIAAVLHENVLLVTGTASEVFSGRAAQVALWGEDFAAGERAVYVRTPECVRVSAEFPVALERVGYRSDNRSLVFQILGTGVDVLMF